MIKTKKIDSRYPLVITGYILFTLLIISILLSIIIPSGIMLFNPRVLHYNVVMFMVSLTIGALLPAFLGYVMGDHSVKAKGRLRHHFNGVLFGLLAYWITTVPSVFLSIPSEFLAGSPNVRLVLFSLLPSIGVAIITALLAVAHVRSRQAKYDIIEYKPYSTVLITAVILLPVSYLINNLLLGLGINAYSFLPLAILALLGGISYATLHSSKLSKLGRVTWSAVSVSVAYVTQFILMLFISGLSNYIDPRPTMESQAITGIAALVLAVIGWVVYWSVQVNSLSRKH